MNKVLVTIVILSWLLGIFGCNSRKVPGIESPISDSLLDPSIQAFLKRPIYKILTKKIMDVVPDSGLNQVVFDNIESKMKGDLSDVSKILEQLSKGQQAIYSIWIVEGEVNNGGFNQLYFNGYESIAKLAEAGFKSVGADKYADLTKRANLIYQKIKPELDKYNDGTLESFSASYKGNPLNECDSIFYELYKSESLSSRIVAYIRKNAYEFLDK